LRVPSCDTPVIGKAEGSPADLHGHVTALTVAPEYRRLGLARGMMHLLEHVSDTVYHGFFVDLFVRCQNALAIGMYERFGYSVYCRVRGYYGSLGLGPGAKDEEDAFGECLFRVRAAMHAGAGTDGRLLGDRYAEAAVPRSAVTVGAPQRSRYDRQRARCVLTPGRSLDIIACACIHLPYRTRGQCMTPLSLHAPSEIEKH
jgi:Acetyltransferase (GNAT) family